MNTPEAGADAYRLKTWDEASVMRAFEDAEDVPIPEEYQPQRGFYQLSLLYEAWLINPTLRADPVLIQKLADLKGSNVVNFPSFALLHDHDVEPYRQILERALNDGSARMDRLDEWVFNLDPAETTRLFDQPLPASVIKAITNYGYDFFIIREDPDGRFTVFALYPEWKTDFWSEENFQITDINENGKDEIALTYHAWGTGFTHFCVQRFQLYEWDGSVFQNIIADKLEVAANTDYGYCMDITFPPDPRGGKSVQSGTGLNTLCPEMPYEQPVRFTWNGQKFQKEPMPIPAPAIPDLPNRCSIDWAIKAGAENDTAVTLLEDALTDWPVEANQEWGPASVDYFRLKLATWQIRRGQHERGLDLLRQVRDHPAAPAYKLPQQIADAFLETYAAGGWYQAQQAVARIYAANQEGYCGMVGCDVEKARQVWGFAEREWGIYLSEFTNDFASIAGLELALQDDPPATLLELKTWLERNQLTPSWMVEGDLDGSGSLDWLVEIKREYADSKGHYYYELMAFLRAGGQTPPGQIRPVMIDDFYEIEGDSEGARRWQSFRAASAGPVGTANPVVNVFQFSSRLYAFHLSSKNGKDSVTMDLNTWYIGFDEDYLDRVEVKNWRNEGNRLIVQYDGQEAVYTWDSAQEKLLPVGFAPELQEEHVRQAEQAIYINRNPALAVTILNGMLKGRIWETRTYILQTGDTYPAWLRPYLQYLLGLAYEQSGDSTSAVQAYWQLWHDYPASPYSLAAKSKLERKQ